MITEEINKAFNDVDPARGIREFAFKRQSWIVLFNLYNSLNDKQIYPGCSPCFPKVYYFIQKLIQQEVAVK